MSKAEDSGASKPDHLLDLFREEIDTTIARGRYLLDEEYCALRIGPETVGPEGAILNWKLAFPLEARTLLQLRFVPRLPGRCYSFLFMTKELRSNVGTAGRELQQQYDQLRATLDVEGRIDHSAVASVNSQLHAAESVLKSGATEVMSILSRLRSLLAVFCLEEQYAWEHDQQAMPDGIQRMADFWRFSATTAIWTSLCQGSRPRWSEESPDVPTKHPWPTLPAWLFQLQRPAIVRVLNERDEMLRTLFPTEIQRLACGMMLSSIASGRLDVNWEKILDEASQSDFPSSADDLSLPNWGTFCAKTEDQRKVFFRLHAFLKGSNKGKDTWTATSEGWSTQSGVFAAFVRKNPEMSCDGLKTWKHRLVMFRNRHRDSISSKEEKVEPGDCEGQSLVDRLCRWIIDTGDLYDYNKSDFEK